MKLSICLAFVMLSAFQSRAQKNSVETAGKTDSAQVTNTDSVVSKSTLTIGAVYCMNADYYGQTAQQKLPYAAAAATYRFKSGIYFTALAYKLLNDTGKKIASASNVGAGVDFKISKKITADINYSHTFYPSLSPFLQAGNPDNASLTLSYDGWLKPSVGADYAFGKTSSDIFTTAGISKAVTLGSISKKDIIMITPALSVVAGTQHFYQTYITQKKLADSLVGEIFTPITGDPPSSNSFTKAITTFNILSYNFKMPLDYNRANYVVEASCQFSMLSHHTEAGPGKLNSFFSFSFYYQF